MVTFDYRCPLCDAILKVPIKLEGSTGACRQCGCRVTPRQSKAPDPNLGGTTNRGGNQYGSDSVNLPVLTLQYVFSLAALATGLLGFVVPLIGIIYGAYFTASWGGTRLADRNEWNAPLQIWRLVSQPGPHCFICSRTAQNEVTVSVRGKRGRGWTETTYACSEHVANRGSVTTWEMPPVVYIARLGLCVAYFVFGLFAFLLLYALAVFVSYWTGWTLMLPYRKLLDWQYVPVPVQDLVNSIEASRPLGIFTAKANRINARIQWLANNANTPFDGNLRRL